MEIPTYSDKKGNIMNKPLGNYMLISTDGMSLDDYSFFTSLEKARDTMKLAYELILNRITNRSGYPPDDCEIHDNDAWIYSEYYGRTIWNIIKIVE